MNKLVIPVQSVVALRDSGLWIRITRPVPTNADSISVSAGADSTELSASPARATDSSGAAPVAPPSPSP